MATLQLQEAKAKFSEVVEAALKDGPQIVTRRGIEVVAIVPIEQWKQTQVRNEHYLDALLKGPRHENLVPKRIKLRMRKPPKF
jgi:prevent-host-death family protein